MTAQYTEADVEPVMHISQSSYHIHEKHVLNDESSLNGSVKFNENANLRHIYESSDQDSSENLLNNPNQDMIQNFGGFMITRVKQSPLTQSKFVNALQPEMQIEL